MGSLRLEKVKAHGACLRALGPHAVPDRLLGVFGHQRFELSTRSFVLEKSLARLPVDASKFGPGIGRAHVDDADGFNARPWRLDVDQVRNLAKLHAADRKSVV